MKAARGEYEQVANAGFFRAGFDVCVTDTALKFAKANQVQLVYGAELAKLLA